jgi:hypothetical protein
MSTGAVTPLRHRMIEDMNARKLCAGTQRGHIHSCKRFARIGSARPTGTATRSACSSLQLTETGTSICSRNRIMTGTSRFNQNVVLNLGDAGGPTKRHVQRCRARGLGVLPSDRSGMAQ